MGRESQDWSEHGGAKIRQIWPLLAKAGEHSGGTQFRVDWSSGQMLWRLLIASPDCLFRDRKPQLGLSHPRIAIRTPLVPPIRFVGSMSRKISQTRRRFAPSGHRTTPVDPNAENGRSVLESTPLCCRFAIQELGRFAE